MTNTTKMKQDAEEGLRIAEKATEGPWGDNAIGRFDEHVVFHSDDALKVVADCRNDADMTFIADARTRAPEAYRNVIAMAGLNDNLIAERSDLESRFTEVSGDYYVEHKRLVAMGVECDDIRAESERLKTLVSAAESAEEAMTVKAEEHYDRAVKAEAKLDDIRAELAQCKAECARLGALACDRQFTDG